MTVVKLASQLAKMEGKKSQARIGDIREILKLLAALEATHRIKMMEDEGTALTMLGEPMMALDKQATKHISKYLKRKKK